MFHVLRIGAVVAALASAGVLLAPQDWWLTEWLFGKPDPATVATRNLRAALNPERLGAKLKAALDAGDKYLADSFVELARQENVTLDPQIKQRYDSETGGVIGSAQELVRGIWEGKCTSGTAFVGTQIGNGLSFGDMRDLYDQASNYRNGRATDALVIGLAAVGILSTAAVPFHAATSMIKGLAKAERLSPLFRSELTETLAGALNTETILKALPQLSLWDSFPSIGWDSWHPDLSWPLVTEKLPQLIGAVSSGVQLSKLGAFNKLVGDVAGLVSNAGICGAQDALALAQGSGDLDRLSRLAEKRKGATAALLKLLGRDALLLPFDG